MESLSIPIFWLSFFSIIYVYFGYPILLYFLSLFRRKDILKKEIHPSVSIIIAAHNEEKNIADKLINTLQLDYPKELLEIIVFSDASTDKTNEIVKSFKDQGVILYNLNQRLGKTAGQNQSVKKAKGEIIVFSDATTYYKSDAIKKLIRNFGDKSVGCVGGELRYTTPENTSIGRGGGLYWKYEQKIKLMESDIGSLIGVSGCMYAVRKSLYKDINPDIISDFITASEIVKQGYRVAYEPEAICEEQTERNLNHEFSMRVRVAIRSYNALLGNLQMMNFFYYPQYALQLISHKLLRYCVCFAMILTFFSNLMIIHVNVFCHTLFIGQCLFYLLAIAGFLLTISNFKNIPRLFFLPFYFCFLNTASLYAWFLFLLGERKVIWTPSR